MTDSIRDTRENVRELAEALRERDAAYRQLDAAYRQLENLSRELEAIHSSRLWKLAGLYWRVMRRLRRGRTSATAADGDSPSEGGGGAFLPPPPVPARYDVLCFPIIDWDFRFQRPQQLMRRYAEAGHRVFYVAQKFAADGPPWRLAEKIPNVFELTLRGPAVNVYSDALDDAVADRLADALDGLRRDAGFGAAASIVQLPFWAPLARQARERFGWPMIYDCMDHHAGFSTNRPGMLQAERELLATADGVTATSEYLYRAAAAVNPGVTLVRNAADYDHFAAERWRSSPRPVVGYYGAIADWFDADLLADVAQSRAEWEFVLVGSTYSGDTRRLSRLPNVRLVGEKPYSEIPHWLAGFDVAVIPFRRTPLTDATDPVKAYEILAAGKPLVAVPLPELEPLGPLVRRASDAKTFEREIAAALAENDPGAVEARRAYARENTWGHRFRALDAAVTGTFPLVSIVVVTFGNRELNARCLESLFACADWPRFEVIVVDNGSTDGTVEDLRRLASSNPAVTVIENAGNAGFAAANNQGLRAARGDVLVMLNNDTVVTRGWLAPLVRRLRADPGTGMIGPSTNSIGNEAKVDAGYSDIADLPRGAAAFVRAHDGETFPIPVLAMFCVAMRRDVWERVGPLDERFGLGMFEDDDYARRLVDRGYSLLCARDSFVHHVGGASFQRLATPEYRRLFERNRLLFEEKWGAAWIPHQDESTRGTVPLFVVRLRQILRDAGPAAEKAPIVFLPDRPWKAAVPERPRSLALALGRAGRLVFYDCTRSDRDVFAGFVEAGPNVWLYNGPRGVLDRLESPILWATPVNALEISRWSQRRVVEDLTEDVRFAGADPQALASGEIRLRAAADGIFCADRGVAAALGATDAPARHLPNAADLPRRPARRHPANRRGLALVPSDSPRFDPVLLRSIARIRADWDFIACGDAPALPGMDSGPGNVRCVPGGDFGATIGRADVVLLLLAPDPPGASPAALYAGLAAGVSVVSTPLPECAATSEVVVADGPEALARALDAARERGRTADFQARARAFAEANTWDSRAATVLEALDGASPVAAGTADREIRTRSWKG